jgi:hypothetical protein
LEEEKKSHIQIMVISKLANNIAHRYKKRLSTQLEGVYGKHYNNDLNHQQHIAPLIFVAKVASNGF